MRRVLVISTVISLLSVRLLFAAGLSEAEKGIFELEHIGMQIQAVEIEMSLYLAQEEKDSPNYNKGASIKPAKKAVDDLIVIKANLSTLLLPQELSELKSQFVGVIDKLVGIYTAVAKKSKIDLDKEFKAFWDMVEAYNNNLKLKIKSLLNVPKDLKEFDLLSYEANLFENPQDKEKFKQAVRLVAKERKYNEAGLILKELLVYYKDTPVEGSVLVRLVDCSQTSADAGLGDPDEILKKLDGFIAKKAYSTQIQKIYLQWRTLKQCMDNGYSNWSGIPNDQYIKVLWELAQSIEGYIDKHPDDNWAKVQLLLLMDTRLIERWGGNNPYGSSAMIDYYDLWGGATI